jgi:hypothetical protein
MGLTEFESGLSAVSTPPEGGIKVTMSRSRCQAAGPKAKQDRVVGLVTLMDAATYIMKLLKAEHDAAEWQAARELETDDDETRFDEKLGEIARQKPSELPYSKKKAK